jgi:PleD family two-component response regulator
MAQEDGIMHKEGIETLRQDITRPKILIVDDEPFNVELLEGYLSKDYDILKAYNGDEALLIVGTNPPDLIMLDIMMPVMDGYEVCSRIKGNEKTIAIPIVIVTALDEKEAKIKAINAGADDFLNKPIDIIELTVRVKSLLKAKQYYDALMGNCNFLL